MFNKNIGFRGIVLAASLVSIGVVFSIYLGMKISGNELIWIIVGAAAITIWTVSLSVIIRRSITGPIRKTVEDLNRISESEGEITERVEVTSGDEIGYLAKSFNRMLDNLRQRGEEKRSLLDKVIKSRLEWVATFDAIQDLISIHDRNDTIIKVNRAFAGKFNSRPEELIGRKCTELLYGVEKGSTHVCPHKKTLATGKIESLEVSEMVFGGSYQVITYPILNRAGEIWAAVHIARDMTEEKILKEQLLHSEKLSSIGELVAGIAHELNNPLMGIMGYSQLIMDTPGDKLVDEVKEKLGRIYHESMRTAKIVQNLLTFARTRKAEKDYHSINAIMKKTLELREYSLKTSNVEVVVDLNDSIPKTMVDFYQLQQVFINIINNAADAMVAENGRGRLEISSDLAGDNIVISFRDDGPGIPREIINKVFDPFFTTKEVGKGTGLGLSITHGIITEHNGSIDVQSPEGGGTQITIELPVLEKAGVDYIEDTSESETDAELLQGKSVLIVDDEKSIRETLSDILSKEGFNVETARDGKEALDHLERDRFSLIIADVKMPGVGGKELYETIVKEHRHLKDKVIMLTGDVLSHDVKELFRTSNCPHMLKPFEARELVGLVRKVLSLDSTDADRLH